MCYSRFKRVMCISCRPHVDVHKGRGSGSCGLMWTGGGGQKPGFLDVINGWPQLLLLFIIMAQAMPLHASAARLWLLSTLSCPASCMWTSVVSDAVKMAPIRISIRPTCISIPTTLPATVDLTVHCFAMPGVISVSVRVQKRTCHIYILS